MDADLTVQHMSTQQLLSDDDLNIIEMAIDKYQKNCLMLNTVRLMDVPLLKSFCDILQKTDHQKHIAATLVNGKQMDVC